MTDPAASSDRLAIRHCQSPGCDACGPPSAVALIRYRPDGRTAAPETRPFPRAGDAVGCTAALSELEAGVPEGSRLYEVCRKDLGFIRTTRAGWLARLRGPRNPGAPSGGFIPRDR